MSEPIKPGDLVRIVRSCCPRFVQGPAIFELRSIVNLGVTKCMFCDAIIPEGAEGTGEFHRIGVPMPWLRKVPPLEELEGEKTQEDIREPA